MKTEIYNIIKEFTGQNNILTIPRVFIKFTGDINTALLLSQLIYWTDRSTNKEGWIYKTYDDWNEELGILDKSLKRSANKLISMGVLETKVKKANGSPTVHYRIKKEEFSIQIIALLDNGNIHNDRLETAESDVLKLSKEEYPLTETTPETTTEITTMCIIPYQKIIEYFNKKTGKGFLSTTESMQKRIRARWNEGYRFNDFIKVIDNMHNAWHGVKTDKFDGDACLRPSTLFGTKFDEYLNTISKHITDVTDPREYDHMEDR